MILSRWYSFVSKYLDCESSYDSDPSSDDPTPCASEAPSDERTWRHKYYTYGAALRSSRGQDWHWVMSSTPQGLCCGGLGHCGFLSADADQRFRLLPGDVSHLLGLLGMVKPEVWISILVGVVDFSSCTKLSRDFKTKGIWIMMQ